MIKVFLLAGITLLVSAMLGIIINDRLKYKLDDFVLPIGFAGLICLLQMLYYPAQLFNLSSIYVNSVSAFTYLVLFATSCWNWKRILNEFYQKRTIWVILSLALFLVTFYQLSLTLEFSDGQMYLGYISSNINIEQINNFNLWTGEIGSEWDSIYLFQGYYHFVSFLCYSINSLFYLFGRGGFVENIVVSVWTPGIIYSVVSSCLLYNITSYFKWKSKYIKYSVLILMLFLLNFYYYRVAFAYYGNTFRTLYISALMFIIFRMLREKRGDFKYLLMIIMGAGIAFSSSYLFISFGVMYCLMAYMFIAKEQEIIRKLSIIVLPLLLYTIAKFSKDDIVISILLLVLSILYYSTCNLKFMKKTYSSIEVFVSKYAIKIFVVGVPLLGILYSVYLYISNPGYPYNFSHYFNNHKTYDMVKDYFFIYSDLIDNILNVIRWSGLLLVISVKQKDNGFRYIKWTYIVCFLTFLNPLNTSFISDMIASNVYYRMFELVFNPFTECLLIYVILNRFEFNRIIIKGLPILLVGLTVTFHLFSYLNIGDSGYGFYLQEGEYVDPIYKLPPEDYEVVFAFRDYARSDYDKERQMIVISHADGLRSFVPEAHQLFTARQYWYQWDRVNQEFYEMSRRHYSWQDPAEIDYKNACAYIKEYNVDYALVRYFENWEFDNATSKCMDTIYEFAEYKIKKSTFE